MARGWRGKCSGCGARRVLDISGFCRECVEEEEFGQREHEQFLADQRRRWEQRVIELAKEWKRRQIAFRRSGRDDYDRLHGEMAEARESLFEHLN